MATFFTNDLPAGEMYYLDLQTLAVARGILVATWPRGKLNGATNFLFRAIPGLKALPRVCTRADFTRTKMSANDASRS